MPQSLSNLIVHLKPYWLQDIGSHAHNPVTEGPDIDLVGQQVGRGGDTVLIFDNGGNPVAEYAASDAGLTAALATIGTGKICQIPSITIAGGPWTIPAGGELQGFSPFQSTLQGYIILGTNSKLNTINIEMTANSSASIYGVQGPITGSAYIQNSSISVIQSGAGNAYAIGAINGLGKYDGSLYVDDCRLYGSSVGGSGYSGRSTRGKLIVTGNTRGMYGSTLRFAIT